MPVAVRLALKRCKLARAATAHLGRLKKNQRPRVQPYLSPSSSWQSHVPAPGVRCDNKRTAFAVPALAAILAAILALAALSSALPRLPATAAITTGALAAAGTVATGALAAAGTAPALPVCHLLAFLLGLR
eukprot:scaffold166_cov47-Phaeocystis_antarctica.AAC.1